MWRRFLLIIPLILTLSACVDSSRQSPAPVTVYGQSSGAGSSGVHNVVTGDTLYSVSKAYRLPMRDIVMLNGLQAPFRLNEGMRLKLPPPQQYTTKEGDTIYVVSRMFGVNSNEIVRLNNLTAPYTLRAGQNLRLPSMTRKTQTVALAQKKNFNRNVHAGNKKNVGYVFAGQQPKAQFLKPQNPKSQSVRGQLGVIRHERIDEPEIEAKLPNNDGHQAELNDGDVLYPPDEDYAQFEDRNFSAPDSTDENQPILARQDISSIPRPPDLTLRPYAAQQNQAVSSIPEKNSKKISSVNPARSMRLGVGGVPERASSKFLKPVEGKILSDFGPKASGLHNDGINIAASRGTNVRAAENGVVVYAGNELKGSGNLVLIRHEDQWFTAYAHMEDMAVKKGDVVARGQTIGSVGTTGSVNEPQLHFEIRRGNDAINPKKYLEKK